MTTMGCCPPDPLLWSVTLWFPCDTITGAGACCASGEPGGGGAGLSEAAAGEEVSSDGDGELFGASSGLAAGLSEGDREADGLDPVHVQSMLSKMVYAKDMQQDMQ